MGASREQQIEEYSWRALSCNPKERAGLAKYSKGLLPQLFSDVPLPDTPIVKGAMEYVEKGPPEYTFDHSLCVFIMVRDTTCLCQRQSGAHIWTHRNGNCLAAIPRMAIQSRDLVVDLTHPRYRHHRQAHPWHFHVIRGRWRYSSFRRSQAAQLLAQAESVTETIIGHQDPVDVRQLPQLGFWYRWRHNTI